MQVPFDLFEVHMSEISDITARLLLISVYFGVHFLSGHSVIMPSGRTIIPLRPFESAI